ncbi:MAG: deoxyguanosinetriphosphate triphosphohydrolase, partial [Dehalococcoidia bacterium]|nr:deoxyguanosinetriphosphate triphosphohydrolase [Dehalococcoidia bacterium]
VGILREHWGKVNTLEGEVCKISDAVAYINHDIGDAIRAGVIREEDLPPKAAKVLGDSHSRRINTMVLDIVASSWSARGNGNDSIPVITMSPRIREVTNELNDFLYERVYNVSSAQEDAQRARRAVRVLYRYFKEHQDRLPPELLLYSDAAERRVVDYIAGMTDQYALRKVQELSLDL